MSELETRAKQLKAVSELGLEALARPEFAVLADRAVQLVSQALRVEIVTVDELQGDGDLVVRATVGLGPVVAESERVPGGQGSLAGHTLLAGHPVITADLPKERGSALRASFLKAGAKSAISVAVGSFEHPWGVLIAVTTSAREFSHDDVAFMQGVSNVLRAAIRIEQTETSRRVSEELFRGGFENSPIGMTLVDTHGVLQEANASFARILGYPDPADLAGLRITSITHPDDAPTDQAVIQQMIDGDYSSHSGEKRYIRKDGAVCHAVVSSTLVHVGAAHASLFFTQVEDITEAKLARRELQRLADAAEQGSDAIMSFDLDNRFRHWNRGAERLLGMAADEVIGLKVGALNALTNESEEQGAGRKPAISGALGGQRGYYETTRRRTDGTTSDLAVSVTPWRVEGEAAGVTSTVTDITARKQAEQANARLAAIVEGSDDAIIGKTLEGAITSWNPSAERMYGYTAADAVGHHISILVPPDREGEFEQIMASVKRGVAVTHLETTRRCKDGRVIEVSVAVSPVRDGSGEIVGAATVARDITERKQIERAREQTLRNLAEAQRLAKLGSWTWDPGRDEATWSPQMYEIFGRDLAAGPATSEELFAYIHPDDRDRIAAGYSEAFGGGSAFELEYRIVTADGIERHIHGLGYEDPGHPGYYVGTVQDVTDQRQAEQERIEMFEATARAEGANLAKSEFLARMSHELRTPLNSIMGFSQLMELEGLQARQQKHVSLVLKAARHLLELINEVLDLARIEAGRLAVSLEPVPLVGAIQEALELVAPLASERNVTAHADTTGIADDAHVSADSNRLKQVLLNLLSNAIKYNRADGQVQISFLTTAAGRVRVRIADTGIGIQADQLPKLFEPFERLGAEQTEIEGTGLGLSLSKALVEAMGGTIEVESEPGNGTTFLIELAAAQRPDAGPDERRPDEHLQELESAPGERRRILYIEDNLSNLTLVEQILERYPAIELISAMQGTLGLDLARQHQPDLIILDLDLPDISGMDVLKRLKGEQITIDIPVVILTADASKTQTEHAHLLGASDYLTKPLDVSGFIDVVAHHLSLLDDGPDSRQIWR
jgi:PAS domain S-box-containing protein